MIICELCCCFSDDLFLLCKGSERELLDFIAKLNTCHPRSFKFEHKYS